MTVNAKQLAQYLLRHPDYEVLIPTKSGVYYPVVDACYEIIIKLNELNLL